MPYSTQTDIENIFGTANVARWSQLDPSLTTANATRIALSIENADALINATFAGSQYVVPFSPTPTECRDWSAKLAGVWLYQSRGINNRGDGDGEDRVSFHRAAAIEEMNLYKAGGLKFYPAVPTVRGGNAPFVVPTYSQYTNPPGRGVIG